MNEPIHFPDILRDFSPGTDDAIYLMVEDSYEGTNYPRPESDEVIDHALSTIAADVFERAEDMSTCNKVDDCIAQAEVLYRLAQLLHPETWGRLMRSGRVD